MQKNKLHKGKEHSKEKLGERRKESVKVCTNQMVAYQCTAAGEGKPHDKGEKTKLRGLSHSESGIPDRSVPIWGKNRATLGAKEELISCNFPSLVKPTNGVFIFYT